MATRYLETHFTPAVLEAQRRHQGRTYPIPVNAPEDPLTEEEAAFIAERDSFYLATVNHDGWPYMQHRGGAPGFLKVLGPNLLAFPDYGGNRQMLSVGNLAENDRTALFLMDYPNQTRLKIIGHTQVLDPREHPDLVALWTRSPSDPRVERIFRIRVVSFDWNCPKFITPRYTAAEIERAVAPLHRRIAELEAALNPPKS